MVFTYIPIHQGVYDQLKLAAEAFLESEDGCQVDAENNQVRLSRIFKWYREDFGGNDKEVRVTSLNLIHMEWHTYPHAHVNAADSVEVAVVGI